MEYKTMTGHMFIDPETVKNLELVQNALTLKDHNTLLEKSLVNNRLDVVEELINLPEKTKMIRDGLGGLGKVDVDKLVSMFSQKPKTNNPVGVTEYKIGLLLQLRNVVRAVPSIRETIRGRRSQILMAVESSGRGKIAMQAKLYAVKANCNVMLDVARNTYTENSADVAQQEMDVPIVTEWCDNGYRFSVSADDMTGAPIPSDWRNIERGKKQIRFTTLELARYNIRLLQSQQEVFLLSDQIVSELVDDVVGIIGCLYLCSEAIKTGRHPILAHTLRSDCVPNDAYAAEGSANFQIIQGPNMSGKSTFLRQIGLITIMAMLGCFVPAEYASFKLHDTLLTRLFNDDQMEKSLSTFAAEMATTAMILGMATRDSLVLIDELGRGTAPIEGMGVAHATAEELIKRKCFVFFATHFRELALTLVTQPGVVLYRNGRGASGEFATTFQYTVAEGACKEEHYGLELAKLAALPPDVMAKATEVAEKLIELEGQGRNASLANAVALRRKAMLELRGKLQPIVEASNLSQPDLAVYLRKIQDHLKETLVRAWRMEQEAMRGSVAGRAGDDTPEDEATLAGEGDFGGTDEEGR
ncbi:MutS protein msh4 [Cryptotrichosporon argae]